MTRRLSSRDLATSPSPLLRAIQIPLMLLGGALLALQAQINGQLAQGLGSGLRSGFLAAVISFGSGLLMLSIILGLLPAGRRGVGQLRAGLRTRRLRPIEFAGGLCGAFFVACQGITVSTIGVALLIVAFTAGQAASSLAVDHIGLSPRGTQAVTLPRVGGAALALVAVFLTAAERLAAGTSFRVAFFTALALLAGALAALQQALNGRLAAVGGPLATAGNNFVVGSLALTGLFALSLIVQGRVDGFPHTWWLYVGGLFGMTCVWIASWTVRIHGVLVLGLCTIAGQVVTAEFIDVLSSDSRVGVRGAVGAALTIAGVMIALILRPSETAIPSN